MNYHRQTRIILLHQNNMLRAENRAMSQALANPSSICRDCNDIQAEEKALRLENALLRSELDTLTCFAARLNSCRALLPGNAAISHWRYAVAVMTSLAAKEVVSLARRGSPMWITESLNVDEYYTKYFPWFARNAPGFVHEASRASALVPCDASELIKTLMTPENWKSIFPSIIGDVSMESHYPEFQLVNVDFMAQISLIKSRNVKLLRCSRNIENDLWVVADIPLYFSSYEPQLRPEFMRFPSGFLVQHITNGVSKVTVLDHWVYKDDQLINYYNSGFGAYKYLYAIQRHCYNTRVTSAPSIAHIQIFDPMSRTNLLSLSTYMVYVFCTGVCGITRQNWKHLHTLGFPLNNIRMFTQEIRDISGLPCVLVSATGSAKLQVKPDTVFGLINGARKQDIWSYLEIIGDLKEVIRLKRSSKEGNEVAIFSIEHTGFKEWYLIEETYMDPTGAMMIHACVDASTLGAVISGGDLSRIELLPYGFTIMPMGLHESVVSAGCHVKAAQAIVTNSDRLVTYLEDMITDTIGKVQSALMANR